MKQKKKKIAALSLAALVAGTGAFHAYSNYQQSGESDTLLNENVMALSSESEDGGESVKGMYTRSTGKCQQSTCNYKKWVSCSTGGTEECYPSDCC